MAVARPEPRMHGRWLGKCTRDLSSMEEPGSRLRTMKDANHLSPESFVVILLCPPFRIT
jgi:hypothetical protein